MKKKRELSPLEKTATKEKNVQEWWENQCKLLHILKIDTVLYRQEVAWKTESVFKVRYKGKYVAELTINNITGVSVSDA